MKIALVSPLYESVPPQQYGGTERVVSYLAEGLVEQGHQVTLFASGDSCTGATLVAGCPRSLRTNQKVQDELSYHMLLLGKLVRMQGQFDIIHFHTDYLHFPLTRCMFVPHVTTMHGRLDLADLVPLYEEFQEVPLISISLAQRRPLAWANWVGTVYHGLPLALFPSLEKEQNQRKENYFAFLGRIAPEKNVEDAIEMSMSVGVKLKIAAKVSKVDEEYFQQKIRPLLQHPLVEFLGEIKEEQKVHFLSKARALLFPIHWPEPFGLVMIEAMACGTPIIAYDYGSVPEVMASGKTGFIVRDISEGVQALQRLSEIDPRECRQVFEQRFTARRMVQDYLRIYEVLQRSGEYEHNQKLDHKYDQKNINKLGHKLGNEHGHEQRN